MDVSEIRRRLNIPPVAGVAWFSVDEKEVAFAQHKSPRHRAVILRSWPDSSPLAWVFARSTSSSNGIEHEAHDHSYEYPSCWIENPARIVTTVPLTIKKSMLDHQTAMCAEPDELIVTALLAVEVAP